MVVSGEQDLEARIDTGLQIFVWSTELGIAGVWLAAQRHLEITDGDVGTFHLVMNTGETLVVVVAAVLLKTRFCRHRVKAVCDARYNR